MEPLAPLALALVLAAFNKALLDLVAQTVERKYPDVDLWWFVFVAMLTGAAMGWFAQVNIFGGVIPGEMVGRILTCLAIGGGTNLINSVFTALPAGATSGLRIVGGEIVPRYRGW